MESDSGLSNYDGVISRREMLAATGASGMALLAGCTGGNQSGDDATFRNAFAGNPVDHHFNTSGVQNYRWPAGRAVFAPFLKYSFNEEKFLFGALKDLQIDGKKVTLTFRDDLTWDNGDDWTTEDLDVQLKLAKKTGTSLWGYLDDYKIVDKKTARLLLSDTTNPQIIKFELTNFLVDTKKETHEKFLNKDKTKFLQWKWEDPVASGPFSFVEKSRQAFEFEPNPEFYNADNINIDTYLLQSFSGNTAQHQALASGKKLDAASSLFVPPKIVKKFPDHVVEINIPAKWGYGIVFNHDDPHFGQRAVRQAVAHVINRKHIVDNAGPRSKFVNQIPCGIAPNDQEYWLGDWMSDFETYGPKSSQTKKATKLLQDAGYSKQNGTWQNSKGTIGGKYYSPGSWTDWTTMTRTVIDQLNEFGFDFTMSTLPTNDWFNQYSNSNFSMGSLYWLPGGSRSSFPYFPLYYQLWEEEIGGGHNYRKKAQSEQTIPGRGGGKMTLTPLKETKKIAQQPSDDKSRPYVQRSAWHSHIELPFLGLVSKYEQSWVTNDDWTIAAKDSPNRKVKWPQFWWPQKGELQYDG